MAQTPFGARIAQLAKTKGMPCAWIAGGREIGFDAVSMQVDAFAEWFAGECIAPRAAVGISIADEHLHLVASLALLQLGVPQVTLATTDPRSMRTELARRIGVARVLTDASGEALDGVPTSSVPLALPARTDVRNPEALVDDPDAPALYITSSGTTGRPKILAYSHRVIALRSEAGAVTGGFVRGDRIVVPMSAQSFAGKVTRLYAYYSGVTTRMHEQAATTAEIVGDCERVRATILFLTVLQASNLIVAAGRLPCRIAPTVRVITSATRQPASMRAAFERDVGGRLYDRYGATEVGVVTTNYLCADDGVPDTVGGLVPGAELEIVDDHDQPLPAGTVGTIRARTPHMNTSYVDDPEATARHFRDGWFYPGDLGAITAEGVVRFLGRRDDMMSLNGINIFPAEIERVLDSHPAVKESAAFPIRSEVVGDIPVAAVELRTPGSAGAEELVDFARERLGVRSPRRIAVLDALPRNAAGKVLKSVLAKRFVAGHFDS